jgi:hypothetical protein
MVQQRIELTPEKALVHLDEVAAKYQGSRDDHRILSGSLQLLQNVVSEWRAMKDAVAASEKAKAETDVRKKVVEAVRGNGSNESKKELRL